MFTTPGFSDERIHLFMATGLERGETAHEADEFMTIETVTLSHALQLIEQGEIKDAKTALGDPLRRWLSSQAASRRLEASATTKPWSGCVKTETRQAAHSRPSVVY